MVLEEGVCTVREIDLGMMAGAGLDPRRGLFPPFWKADLEGLDTILEKLESYEESHGERFAPPRTLGRLGDVGTLEAGKRCDLAIWDIEQPAELVYRIGFNPLHTRVRRGR